MYYIIGLQGLQGIYLSNAFEGWLQAFFFSAQTITTLGYGGIHPTGIAASSVAAVESLAGLFSFALAQDYNMVDFLNRRQKYYTAKML